MEREFRIVDFIQSGMKMVEYNEKLINVLRLTAQDWEVTDYQLAGMGWAAVLAYREHLVTLHCDRGWVDIYRGPYQEQQLLGSKKREEDIVALINQLS
uniref:hypothetical protein n=1 Tax=Thaumasiovibrio occultus TaxID=1891184 RepID=UPI00131C0213|nr:hypothetical protein [Thaumasiovibrio occultus]